MRRISAKSKFTIIMVSIALLAVFIIGFIAWDNARVALRAAEFSILSSIRSHKAREIENYFETINNQLVILSEDQMIISAMVQLGRGFSELEEADIPAEYDTTLEAYYTSEYLPRLSANLSSGVPEYNVFRPQSQPGRYLQHYYIAANGNAVGFKQFLDNPEDGSDYSQFHEQYHDNLREFLLRFGYSDLFLIDFDSGDIVYSVFKEADYGTNLLTGPYRNTGLADVVNQVRKDPIRQKAQIIDYQPYAPSYNAPAAFIAAPIFNGEHIVGILALQLPVDEINAIMTGDEQWEADGLGATGETFLVGSDMLMRSDLRPLIENPDQFHTTLRQFGTSEPVVELISNLETTILLHRIDTEGVQAAFAGETDTREITNYRGVPALAAFAPLSISGLDWVIISEIDSAEAFAPVVDLLRIIFIVTSVFIPLVAISSIRLSREFIRPVLTLIDTAKEIVEGYGSNKTVDGLADPDLPESVGQMMFDTDAAGEFNELASVMNEIIVNVREDSEDAEEKHAEYTGMLMRTLPESVAERYQNGETAIVDKAKQATAIFITIQGFPSMLDGNNLETTMELYHELNQQFNAAGRKYGIDLFNQIGMEYVGVCGLTTPYLNHTERVTLFAQSAIETIRYFNARHHTQLVFQIGIDAGPLVGGLTTSYQTSYEVWGDAIYIAQEVGYVAEPNKVAVSQAILPYLSDKHTLVDLESTIRLLDKEIPVWGLILQQSADQQSNPVLTVS